MGEKKRNKAIFLEQHPFCAFCGGNVPATTQEHCPPRIIFKDRQWPEGFVFPACLNCNSGTRLEDELIGLMVMLEPFDSPDFDSKAMDKLMRSIKQKYPSFIERIMPTAREARNLNKQRGIAPSFGETQIQASGIKVPDEFHRATKTLAYKLSKGIFYKETGSIFPNSGRLYYKWFTNTELVINGSYSVLDMLAELNGITRPIIRNGKHLNNQFNYKVSFTEKKDVLLLQAAFGLSFSFIVFGALDRKGMENTISKMEKSINSPNPFISLQ